MLRRFVTVVPVLAGCAAVPVLSLWLVGKHMVMPPLWVHFYGVGVTALVATAAAIALTTAGARARDGRTVIVGGAFSVMAALLAVHGLVTPGVLIWPHRLIALSGGGAPPGGAAGPLPPPACGFSPPPLTPPPRF